MTLSVVSSSLLMKQTNGTDQADKVDIGSKDMGIKEQTYENNGKVVITIKLDGDGLQENNSARNAE